MSLPLCWWGSQSVIAVSDVFAAVWIWHNFEVHVHFSLAQAVKAPGCNFPFCKLVLHCHYVHQVDHVCILNGVPAWHFLGLKL